MKLEMRIVAMSHNSEIVVILERINITKDFSQMRLSFDDFDRYMLQHFPNYYRYYEMAKENEKHICRSAEWFYHFGETSDMRRKGIAFTYKS